MRYTPPSRLGTLIHEFIQYGRYVAEKRKLIAPDALPFRPNLWSSKALKEHASCYAYARGDHLLIGAWLRPDFGPGTYGGQLYAGPPTTTADLIQALPPFNFLDIC